MTQKEIKWVLCESETWTKKKYVADIQAEEIKYNLNVNKKKVLVNGTDKYTTALYQNGQ